MRTLRFAVAVTLVNLALAGFTLKAAVSASLDPVQPVLRGRSLELVDQHGKLRSRLSVEPGGEVVLRLLDANGTIRVKLGAGEDGSGLLLLDEATEPGIHLIARRSSTAGRPATTSLTLRADDQTRVIRP